MRECKSSRLGRWGGSCAIPSARNWSRQYAGGRQLRMNRRRRQTRSRDARVAVEVQPSGRWGQSAGLAEWFHQPGSLVRI